jgi:hypothetical protein
MSDFTITDAQATGNVTTPQDIPVFAAVDITVTLTISNTIVFPITVSAQVTTTTATSIDYPAVIGPDILGAAPVEFIIPVQTTPVTQVANKVSQNYLVTVTDSDARTQTINIATPATFPVDTPNNPAGYPSVVAVGA